MLFLLWKMSVEILFDINEKSYQDSLKVLDNDAVSDIFISAYLFAHSSIQHNGKKSTSGTTSYLFLMAALD